MPLLATAIATPDHLAEHLQDLRLASLARPRDGGLALGIAEAGLGATKKVAGSVIGAASSWLSRGGSAGKDEL